MIFASQQRRPISTYRASHIRNRRGTLHGWRTSKGRIPSTHALNLRRLPPRLEGTVFPSTVIVELPTVYLATQVCTVRSYRMYGGAR